jgi:hypothetical protein
MHHAPKQWVSGDWVGRAGGGRESEGLPLDGVDPAGQLLEVVCRLDLQRLRVGKEALNIEAGVAHIEASDALVQQCLQAACCEGLIGWPMATLAGSLSQVIQVQGDRRHLS